MRNGLGRSSLKEQKYSDVSLRLYILRIDNYSCLQFRNRQVRPLIAQIVPSLLDMRCKFLLLISCYLRYTGNRTQEENNPRSSHSKYLVHIA